ncbi:LPS assembly lipoprotein LptE [Rhodovulum visakhapatnamense]|uniref:LPS-assembly lipoprotein n=1 Tax=Rhodovulum visakhapatnamense TaxID=364297 RepID=A0A4R8G5B1_9RHOB|nr:LPS assembly lipoprotein LptE [Rhodovulum visakhapatnamense]TDX31893.1 LPS-assembly lipoprotein [Rhodovulum visakhapatnamense]
MSSSDRRAFLVSGLTAAGLALAGCGFRPVYGPGGPADGLRGRIAVDAPDSVVGFLLVEELETRLGRAEAPRWRLAYSIDTESEGLGVTAEQDTTRYNITGRVGFQLRDLDSGQVVQSGEVASFTAYSATGSTVATRAAERDAYRRLMVILADEVVTRLLATSGTWAQ